jgi:hypothetical protein
MHLRGRLANMHEATHRENGNHEEGPIQHVQKVVEICKKFRELLFSTATKSLIVLGQLKLPSKLKPMSFGDGAFNC